MTRQLTARSARIRMPVWFVVVATLLVGCAAPGPSGAPDPTATAGPADTIPSAVASGIDLGSVAPGGRLDAPSTFVATGSDTWTYDFDVAAGRGRLRVALDLSNRDDCVILELVDPRGLAVAPASHDNPAVCPEAGRSGQAFGLEQSVADPVVGRWRATVDITDARALSLRLRVAFEAGSAAEAGRPLPPDLVPWLPWEFGFAAPASDRPGTANDRVNQPGDPAVSCHPVEEPDDTRCLRFSAGMYNVGAGPMYVSFRGDDAYQHVYHGDATPQTFADNEQEGRFTEAAAGRGEWHEFHFHRHLADFVLYELFAVSDAAGTLTPVDTGNKHGYCTFSQQIHDWAAADLVRSSPRSPAPATAPRP